MQSPKHHWATLWCPLQNLWSLWKRKDGKILYTIELPYVHIYMFLNCPFWVFLMEIELTVTAAPKSNATTSCGELFGLETTCPAGHKYGKIPGWFESQRSLTRVLAIHPCRVVMSRKPVCRDQMILGHLVSEMQRRCGNKVPVFSKSSLMNWNPPLAW